MTPHSTWNAASAELGESTLGQKFHLGLKTAVAAAIAGLMALSSANAQEGKFYESMKGQVVEISENAAQDLAPDHWEIWLFRRNTTPGPDPNSPDHWGSGSDKSLAKLMESNRKAIAFDHTYERWCGCDGGDFVHDNYFGPVAVMPDSNPNSVANRIQTTLSGWKDKLDELQEKADTLQEWWDDFKQVTGISNPEDDLEDLQKKVKDLDPGAIKGYIENSMLGFRQLAAVRAALEGASQAGNTALLLSQATQDLDAAEKYGQTISQASNASQQTDNNEFDVNSGGTFSLPDDFTSDYSHSDITNTQSVTYSSGQLRVSGTVTYTKWDEDQFPEDACPNGDQIGVIPKWTNNSAHTKACVDDLVQHTVAFTCGYIAQNCNWYHNPQKQTESYSYIVSTREAGAKLTAKLEDKDDNSPWTVDIGCTGNSVCFQSVEGDEATGEIYFSTKEAANNFIAKINAQKPILSNAQKTMTLSSPESMRNEKKIAKLSKEMDEMERIEAERKRKWDTILKNQFNDSFKLWPKGDDR